MLPPRFWNIVLIIKLNINTCWNEFLGSLYDIVSLPLWMKSLRSLGKWVSSSCHKWIKLVPFPFILALSRFMENYYYCWLHFYPLSSLICLNRSSNWWCHSMISCSDSGDDVNIRHEKLEEQQCQEWPDVSQSSVVSSGSHPHAGVKIWGCTELKYSKYKYLNFLNY